MFFSDIQGHATLKLQLAQAAQTGRIPHAQIFAGGTGSAKLALVLALTKYILCNNPTPTDACGTCNTCSKTEKLIHPDVHFAFPTIGANAISSHFLPQWRDILPQNPYLDAFTWLQHIGAENKQGNINKDECNQIIKQLSLKKLEGKYKILILWLPEYLQKEGNRLLKLIEEPPEHTLFFLITENTDLVLSTILSRCQMTLIPSFTDAEVTAALEKKGIARPYAETAAHLSDGNLNMAQQLATSSKNDQSQRFVTWLRVGYKGNGVEIMAWVEQFATLGRENQKFWLQYALHFLREYTVFSLTGNKNLRLNTEERATAQNLLRIINFDQTQRIVTLLDELATAIERNANVKILMTDAAIQLHYILGSR
jgi:DNA polymerase III subunit delta'